MLIGLCAPFEHVWSEVDTCALAEGLDNSGRIVQQIVGIYDAHLDTSSDSVGGVDAVQRGDPVRGDTVRGDTIQGDTIRGVVAVRVDAIRGMDAIRADDIRGVSAVREVDPIGALPCNLWPDLADRAKIVKQPAQLVVSRLGGHEVVKPGDLVQWRDTAAIIRRNARPWMSYQECEMEVSQRIPRDYGGVVGLSIRVVRIRSLGGTIRGTVDHGFGGPNTTFDSAYRWCNARRCSLRWEQVVGHILDQETLAL